MSKVRTIVSQYELLGEENYGKYVTIFDDGEYEEFDAGDPAIPREEREQKLEVIKATEELLGLTCPQPMKGCIRGFGLYPLTFVN